MILLGVDPGINRMGYGVINTYGSQVSLLEGGAIKGGPSSIPLSDRLLKLYKGISEVIMEYKPAALALEDIYSHYAYPNTAVIMGHARGVVFLASAERGVPVFSYSATRVKHSVVGSGRATKMQVQKSIQAKLNLKHLPEPNDVSDALALAICHWQISWEDNRVSKISKSIGNHD